MDTYRSPELIRSVQSSLDHGLSLTATGNANGVSRATIHRMLIEGVVTERNRPGRGSRSIVPVWVPDDLRAEFFDNRRLYGEIHAARLARVAKAEAARPEI